MTATRHGACEACLRRTWLLQRLAGHIELERTRLSQVLALDDAELIAALGGYGRPEIEREWAKFDPDPMADRIDAAGLEALCRCDDRYPARLRALEAPPAVLHVAGGLTRFLELCSGEPVAIVGARRASEYGLEVARSLGRGLGAAGLTTVSGLARGIDAAAHRGTLEAVGGRTVAVVPGSAGRAYPAGQRLLHAAVVAGGAAISELGPGTRIRRWLFLARNRLIAALSALTVVVEAGEHSGALPTAETARELGRPIGAVPGRVTSPQAAGPNHLLAQGAIVIRGAQDVLDSLYGPGSRALPVESRPPLSRTQRDLLDALGRGDGPAAAAARAGVPLGDALATVAQLELAGWVRRGAGGSYIAVP
jgi:DNA processing protein